jgi:outer membrane protein OmpA-like peptidoglycan-associated protein/ABC-type nitrate/sulfonate/bicarbonate transport system substrate-binding protein
VRIKAGGRFIIGLVLIGGALFGANKFGLFDSLKTTEYKTTTMTSSSSDTVIASVAAGPISVAREVPAPTSASELTVSLVSFHGYAPAILANGDALVTQPGSIYNKLGLKLNIVIQDDIPTLATIFEAGTAQCAWRTSDFWAQEQPNLRNAKLDARAVMIVDNTQGGDAIISKDPNIKSVEDLAGKQVALLQFTPSHGLIIDAVNNSSLSAKKKDSVKYIFINADEGTGGVRAAYESGKVDAAVLWDPDLSLAMRSKGANGTPSHVVYSTKSATNLIYDVMVCNSKVLASQSGRQAVQKFVDGWMQGVKAAKADPDEAVKALVNTEPMFAQLQKSEGSNFIKGLFPNLVWTGLDDNARILGLVGDTNHYERVYKQFDEVYRAAGALANPNSPVINPSDSFDYSFIKTLLARDQQAQQSATAKVVQDNNFTTAGAAQTTSAAVTKPVQINFTAGNGELTARAKAQIDHDMVPFIENNGSAYVEISGNADSTGSDAINKPLSLKRAQSVADYLVKQWEFPVARFKVIGNGSDKPICNERNPAADGLTLDDCRAANRTTRVAILRK